MTPLILMLLAFVVIGLFRDRIGASTYLVMGIVILAFVYHAYHTG